MSGFTINLTSSIQELRELYPVFKNSNRSAFFDNAGGSQLPSTVIDSITSYLVNNYVQTASKYPESIAAGDNIVNARKLVKIFVGAADHSESAGVGHGPGEIVFGPSTTVLCNLVAQGYGDAFVPGLSHPRGEKDGDVRDEIIVGVFGHEGNIWCWDRLQYRGYKVKYWDVEEVAPGKWQPKLETLRGLLTNRTRVVAFAHVSNILGEVYDVPAITALVHEFGARVFVDGVAFAPHRLPRVSDWGVDWYVYSPYKVFGPHMGAIYGRREAWLELIGPNHSFIPKDELPRKWEPGGANHESCAAINGLWPFLCAAINKEDRVASSPDRQVFEESYGKFAFVEEALQKYLLDWMASKPSIRVIGPSASDAVDRLCIVSFVVEGKKSADVAAHLNQQGLGVKAGNFYSRRLIERVGLDPVDGVARVSLAHYNSFDELKKFFRVLEEIL